MIYKSVSKGADPEGKQEGRGKADVKYILLAYMHLYVLYINICIFCPKTEFSIGNLSCRKGKARDVEVTGIPRLLVKERARWFRRQVASWVLAIVLF